MGQIQAKEQADVDGLRKFYDAQFETQLIAANLQWAQQRAVDLLQRRDQLQWEVLAAATTTAVLLTAGSIYKRKDLIIPIVPLIMGCGYRYDVAHGENRQMVREDVEKILANNSEQLQLLPPITLKDVDQIRKECFRRDNNIDK